MTVTHDAPDTTGAGSSPAPAPSRSAGLTGLAGLAGPDAPPRRRRSKPPAPLVVGQRRADARRAQARRAPEHRARKVLRPTITWRVFVATVGAFVLTLCSGMALGVVSISRSGVDLRFGDGPQAPPQVTGTDGVYPGGAARNVSLTVQNTIGSAFEISAVIADLSDLPEECPAGAWQVGVPGLLPTVPARSEVTVPLPVTLRADAPDSCQGRTVRFPVRIEGLRHPLPLTDAASAASVPPSSADAAGAQDPAETLRPEQLDAVATVTAARLGTPRGTATARGDHVEIVPARPASGPAPTAFDIAVAGSGSHRTTLCERATTCIHRDVPRAAPLRYVVTARLGDRWVRESAPLTTWTPPPAPSLQFADGDRPAGSALLLQARGGSDGYDIGLYTDGTDAPFHTAHVAAGRFLDQTVPAPELGPGTHRVVAVARYHGWRTPSAALQLTISEDGDVTPGPVEEPGPVSGDPDPAGPTDGGPPVVPVPTRTTTASPITIRSKAPAVPAAPPQPTIEDAPSAPPAEEPPAPAVPEEAPVVVGNNAAQQVGGPPMVAP